MLSTEKFFTLFLSSVTYSLVTLTPLPSADEKVITICFFLSPSGLAAFPRICLLTCLHLGVCLSPRLFLLYLFSLSLWLQTLSLSLSPSSLQPLFFAPPTSELQAVLGFRRITLTMLDQYRYWSAGKMFIKSLWATAAQWGGWEGRQDGLLAVPFACKRACTCLIGCLFESLSEIGQTNWLITSLLMSSASTF